MNVSVYFKTRKSFVCALYSKSFTNRNKPLQVSDHYSDKMDKTLRDVLQYLGGYLKPLKSLIKKILVDLTQGCWNFRKQKKEKTKTKEKNKTTTTTTKKKLCRAIKVMHCYMQVKCRVSFLKLLMFLWWFVLGKALIKSLFSLKIFPFFTVTFRL